MNKGKNNANKKTKDLYKYYINSVEAVDSIKGTGKTKGLYNIKPKVYGEILRDIHDEIMSMVILNNFEFNLPVRMGTLRIGKKKLPIRLTDNGELIKGPLQVDWKATNDLWNISEDAKKDKVRVFYTNEHTNGYKHRFRWSKMKMRLENMYYYSFIPSRTNKRLLAKYLKDSNLNLNYYELKGHNKIK